MPTTNVIPTPQTLPEGFCPTTWQDTLDAFAAGMRVTLPTDYGQIIISQTTPGSGEHGKIWFKTDAGGQVLGIYSWDTVSGSWKIAKSLPNYFIDTGSNSAIVITTGESISSLSDLTGRLFLVNIAVTNTSATITFKVDSLAAKDVFVSGGDLPAPGAVKQDMIAALVYDGTDFQLLNSATLNLSAGNIIGGTNKQYLRCNGTTSGWESQYETASGAYAAIPAMSDVVEFSHGFSTIPSWVRFVLICTDAAGDATYAQNDEVDINQARYPDNDNEYWLGTYATSTKIGLARPDSMSAIQVIQKSGAQKGHYTNIDTSKWKVKAYALR